MEGLIKSKLGLFQLNGPFICAAAGLTFQIRNVQIGAAELTQLLTRRVVNALAPLVVPAASRYYIIRTNIRKRAEATGSLTSSL